MGFDVLAFESGLYDCHRAWQAFEDGNPPMEAARQGVFGIWTGSKQTGPLWSYLSERVKSDSPLELAGFDCQFTASASRAFLVADLKSFINQHESARLVEAELEDFYKQLQGLVDRKYVGEKSNFDKTLKSLTDVIAQSGSSENGDAKFWKQNLASIQAYADYTWVEDQDAPQPGIMKRDAQMARNLIWMHQKQFPKQKIIVWAASFHIMRNPAGIEVPDGSIDYSEMVQMGHSVAKSLGNKVFTVGFTASDGAAGAYFRPAFGLAKPPTGTLEDIFVQADIANGWLSLNPEHKDGAWLNEELFSRPLGYKWMKANWGQHFDAMIFNREMKPSTR